MSCVRKRGNNWNVQVKVDKREVQLKLKIKYDLTTDYIK